MSASPLATGGETASHPPWGLDDWIKLGFLAAYAVLGAGCAGYAFTLFKDE